MNSLSPEDMELVQAWLDKTLPETERQGLEARFEREPELRAGAEELRILLNKLHILRRQEWQSRLNAIKYENLDTLGQAPKNKWKWLFWSIIGLIGVAVLLWIYQYYGKEATQQPSMSPIAQVSTEFISPPWIASDRGDAPPRVLNQAGQAYVAKDFSKAAQNLEKYLAKAPSNDDATVMLIVCYLKTGNGRKAWPLLQKLERKNNVEQVQWFKALSLIQMNQIPKAGSILEKLVGGNGDYAGQAKEMLEKINQY